MEECAALGRGAYPLMLGWLCTCETSTPFLSTRWFIRQMKEMEYTQPLLDKLAHALGMKSRGLVAARIPRTTLLLAAFHLHFTSTSASLGNHFDL